MAATSNGNKNQLRKVYLQKRNALNENDMTAKNIAINRGGYLNAAIRWTFVEHLHIEMNFNNLLFDGDRVDYFNRELSSRK